MSASFLLLRNSFPSSGQQNSCTECGACLNYDAQTCCLLILPITAATGFFIWLFFQKGHFAVGLVLAQLLAIILLGVLAFLLAYAARRCWRHLKNALMKRRAKQKNYSTENGGVNEQMKQQEI